MTSIERHQLSHSPMTQKNPIIHEKCVNLPLRKTSYCYGHLQPHYAMACVFVFPSFPLRMDLVCNVEGKNEPWFYPLPLRNLYRRLEREMPVSLCNCRSDRNAVLAADHLEIPALISRCETRRNWVAAFKMVCAGFFLFFFPSASSHWLCSETHERQCWCGPLHFLVTPEVKRSCPAWRKHRGPFSLYGVGSQEAPHSPQKAVLGSVDMKSRWYHFSQLSHNGLSHTGYASASFSHFHT